MQLYVSLPSPYGRKAVVAALESGAGEQVEIVRVDPWADPQAFLATSAVGKVPALVLGDGSVLLESTAIARYLFDVAGRTAASASERLDESRRTGLAQGLIDATYAAVIEGRRPPEKQWDEWVERQHRAIGRILAALAEPAVGRFDIGDITLACALGYLDFRRPGIAWRDRRPDLAPWFAAVGTRPSMLASAPDR